MKFETAVTIGAVALWQQHYTGVVGAALKPRVSTTTTISTRNLSSLIAASKQRFQERTQHQHRHLADTTDESDEDPTDEQPAPDDFLPTCDVSFVNCLSHNECAACFQSMTTNKIDWATLAYGTECEDIIKPLVEKNICKADLKTDVEGKKAFCSTMQSCAVKPEDKGKYYNDDDDETDARSDDVNEEKINCDGLTSCDFKGYRAGLIGDGACHEWINGCYNTAACGYDGGDCCEDTCSDKDSLVNCGSDNYFCRDPASNNCQTPKCIEARNSTDDSDNDPQKSEKCPDGETGYLLLKYASFGNGWDRTYMTIDEKNARKKGQLYKGTMEGGASEQEIICLSNDPTCYDVQLGGGTWGNRVSWQLKPMMEGAPELASGGAPLQCQFTVGGDVCKNTCLGQSDEEPHKDDSEHHSYEVMEKCIESTCLIQLASCEYSKTCSSCITQPEPPAYCYSDPNFNALVQCTLCSCMPEASSSEGFDEYCASMDQESVTPKTGTMPVCNSDQLLDGVGAVLTYNDCSDVGFEAAVTTNFDNEHFGRLDAFESCATTYTTAEFHGGKKALDCMRILQEAVENPTDDANDPAEAISSMAYHLYNDGKNFCDCSATASESCPVCLDFENFKTLMYESLDACRALDAIDCAAWAEFSTPCQANMQGKFGNAAFSSQVQCEYVHEGCGNAGPFPSFRNLNCNDGTEISDPKAWDFYLLFESSCLKDQDGTQSNSSKPKAAPVSPPSKINPVPTPNYNERTTQPTKRYIPDNDGGSTTDSNSNSNSSEDGGKKTKSVGGFKKFLWFVFFCIVCGGGYWYYKRTREFDYVRFRRARNYGGDSIGMYEGSTLGNSASSFEPPSLPPPPSAYESNNNNFA